MPNRHNSVHIAWVRRVKSSVRTHLSRQPSDKATDTQRRDTVKTLAIRGTVEEALVSRRQAVRSGSMSGQALDMPDDLIRLHFLRHPQFLPEPLPEPDRDVELDFPLLPRLRSEKRGADTFNGSADNSDGIGARLPKRRKNGLAVRFAPMDSNLVEL